MGDYIFPVIGWLLLTGLLALVTVPLMKILVKGIRNGQFEATKISNARWSERPIAFCLDGFWIFGWVWQGLGAWAYASFRMLSLRGESVALEWVEQAIATPAGRMLMMVYAIPLVLHLMCLPSVFGVHFGRTALGALSTGKFVWNNEQAEPIFIGEAPVRFLAYLLVASALSGLGWYGNFWLLRIAARYFGLV